MGLAPGPESIPRNRARRTGQVSVPFLRALESCVIELRTRIGRRSSLLQLL